MDKRTIPALMLTLTSSTTTMAEFLDGEWNRALELQLRRLEGKKYVGALRRLSYESFQSSIEEADRHYAGRNIARHVTALEPSLAHLNSFVAAITSIIQGTGPIAGFIWGLIQMIIVVSWYLVCLTVDMLSGSENE
jgi:fatty acid desaturase